MNQCACWELDVKLELLHNKVATFFMIESSECLNCAPRKRAVENVTVSAAADSRPEVEGCAREDAVVEVLLELWVVLV